MISATQRCLLSWESATKRSMCGRSTGRKASLKLRNNPWRGRRMRINFFIGWLKLFSAFVRESHLEQTEPARAKLVLALSVLKWEKLDELVDEYWVWEMVKDDLLPLLGRAWKWNLPDGVNITSHYWMCYIFRSGCDCAQTSVISSLVRFCLGCSSSGAYVISFLENNHEVMVNKNKVKGAVWQISRETSKYMKTADRTEKHRHHKMRTLASCSIPSESFPQTHSHPSPAVCVAGCCCYTGATGCLDGPLLQYHLAPSLHLPKTSEDLWDEV